MMLLELVCACGWTSIRVADLTAAAELSWRRPRLSAAHMRVMPIAWLTLNGDERTVNGGLSKQL